MKMGDKDFYEKEGCQSEKWNGEDRERERGEEVEGERMVERSWAI